MQGEVLEYLIEKYLEGSASDDELNRLEVWYNAFGCKADLYVRNTLESSLATAKNFSELKLKLGIG